MHHFHGERSNNIAILACRIVYYQKCRIRVFNVKISHQFDYLKLQISMNVRCTKTSVVSMRTASTRLAVTNVPVIVILLAMDSYAFTVS